MTWLFSKRCKQSLKEKKIKVSIPLTVRNRILIAMNIFCDVNWHNDNGMDYSMTTLDYLPAKIKEELGCKDLFAFPETGEGPAVPGNLEDFVMRGYYPPFLFDVVELFYDSVDDENKIAFQRRFNEIMVESDLPWRMADGKIFPVDSTYIEEEITRRAYNLLHEAKFQGALQEFEKARVELTNGNSESAIQNANLAVESVIKEILGIEKAKPGALFRKLIDSKIIPEYYDGFLNAFEENILRCVAVIRNEEPSVGHGRGPQGRKVPLSLAELAVHLSAVLICFLINRNLEAIDQSVKKQKC